MLLKLDQAWRFLLLHLLYARASYLQTRTYTGCMMQNIVTGNTQLVTTIYRLWAIHLAVVSILVNYIHLFVFHRIAV